MREKLKNHQDLAGKGMVKIRIAKLLHLLQAHAYVGIMKRERDLTRTAHMLVMILTQATLK